MYEELKINSYQDLVYFAGNFVRVTTHDGASGICQVIFDRGGPDLFLATDNPDLGKSNAFWEVSVKDIQNERLKKYKYAMKHCNTVNELSVRSIYRIVNEKHKDISTQYTDKQLLDFDKYTKEGDSFVLGLGVVTRVGSYEYRTETSDHWYLTDKDDKDLVLHNYLGIPFTGKTPYKKDLQSAERRESLEKIFQIPSAPHPSLQSLRKKVQEVKQLLEEIEQCVQEQL